LEQLLALRLRQCLDFVKDLVCCHAHKD
jgi:hypothetical protein